MPSHEPRHEHDAPPRRQEGTIIFRILSLRLECVRSYHPLLPGWLPACLRTSPCGPGCLPAHLLIFILVGIHKTGTARFLPRLEPFFRGKSVKPFMLFACHAGGAGVSVHELPPESSSLDSSPSSLLRSIHVLSRSERRLLTLVSEGPSSGPLSLAPVSAKSSKNMPKTSLL